MPSKTANKQAAAPETATPKAIDVSAWSVNTSREAPKRKVIKEGMDRSPVYALLERLETGQVVELPALDSKAAKSMENLVREAAKDKGLSVTFLADQERNSSNGELPEDHSYYVWFVKGPYQPRGSRKSK